MDSTANQDEEYEKLKKSRFKQQQLPAWRPVPTIRSTTITFVSCGILFITIGVIVLIFSKDIIQIVKRYDDECSGSPGKCTLKIELTTPMKPPVMVYYQLNNFYQNHRRYVKSKSDAQLSGKMVTLEEVQKTGDCSPVETNAHMGKNQSISGHKLNPNDIAVPCGLIAKSLFNDTFKMVYKGLDGTSEEEVTINESDIAWEADKQLKYKNVQNPNDKNDKEYYKNVQWIDMTNEHFIVWMRPAGLPNFRKLWGKIKGEGLKVGKYDIKIQDNFQVSTFNGEKYFVLSTVNAFGGKNKFLGIAYLVAGGVSLALAITFLIGYKIHQRKEQ
jgi:hypothetical protein